MRISVLGAATCAVLSATAVHAAPIVNESFESYANTAAMLAAWPGGTTATLQTTGGNPGQFASHPGLTVNSKTFAAINPTDAQPLKFSFDIFDDGVSANKRMTGGLRGVGANIVEMGMFNNPNHYAFRVVLFASGNPVPLAGWTAFDTLGQSGLTNTPRVGWHRMTALIGNTTSTFTLDLGADGSIEATHTLSPVPTAGGFSDVRFGGPSNVSSAGGSGGFDNILVEQVIPEPASLGLIGIAGAAMLRRRRA